MNPGLFLSVFQALEMMTTRLTASWRLSLNGLPGSL